MSEDISAITDKLKEILGSSDIGSLIGIAEPRQESHENQPDIEMILKLKKAYDRINSKPDPRATLLASLKPYMNERRSAELDRISGLLNLTKITDIINALKGGI